MKLCNHNLFFECKQETKPKEKKKMKKTPRPDESFEMISSFVISELRVCVAMCVPNHVVYTWNVHSIFITTCLSVHLNFYKYSTTTQILSLVYCFLLPFSLWDRNRWKKNKSQDFRRRQRRLNASQLISLQTKHFRSFIAIAIIRFDYWELHQRVSRFWFESFDQSVILYFVYRNSSFSNFYDTFAVTSQKSILLKIKHARVFFKWISMESQALWSCWYFRVIGESISISDSCPLPF